MDLVGPHGSRQLQKRASTIIGLRCNVLMLGEVLDVMDSEEMTNEEHLAGNKESVEDGEVAS